MVSKNMTSIARKALLITLFILLIPLIAMIFTKEVSWEIVDFGVMGALIFSTGLLFGIISKVIKNKSTKFILSIAIILLFLLIWAELAVGIFNTPFAGS